MNLPERAHEPLWEGHAPESRYLTAHSLPPSYHAAAAAKSLQSCLTLCNPRDGSPPGSPVPGILQARTLEWVAISFSNAGKWKVKVKLLSRVQLLVTPWTTAYQPPPSMGLSRPEYWSGVPLPSLVEWLMSFHIHYYILSEECFLIFLMILITEYLCSDRNLSTSSSIQ